MNTFSNRGMGFEMILDRTNEMYDQKGIAIINKRPTPVKVISKRGNRVSGFFQSPSTVDYDGVYNGRPVVFEAKSVKHLTRFDFKNLHQHQYDYLEKCHQAGAIAFLLVEFTSQHKTYLLTFEALRPYWSESQRVNGKKSMNIVDFDIHAYEVEQGEVPVDYLRVVNEIWFNKAI